MLTKRQEYFLERAIQLSREGMQQGSGGPFGCVIVKDDIIIAEGVNRVTSSNDPTAHAEIMAIRDACKQLDTYQLSGCELFASCEPCPMCLGAIYWSRVDKVIYANTRADAAAIGFDDDFIYQQIATDIQSRSIQFIHHPHPLAGKVFEEWTAWDGKTSY